MSAVALLALVSACAAQPFLPGQNMLPGGEGPGALLMLACHAPTMPSWFFRGSLLVNFTAPSGFTVRAAHTWRLVVLQGLLCCSLQVVLDAYLRILRTCAGNIRTVDTGGPYDFSQLSTQVNELQGAWCECSCKRSCCVVCCVVTEESCNCD